MKKSNLLLAALVATGAIACGLALTACTASGHDHAYTETTVAATCTEQGYVLHSCECGESYKDGYTDALNHDTETHSAKPATCTEDGWDEYLTCKRDGCGYTTYAVISAGHKSVTDKAVPATCTVDGKTEGSHCGVCGDVLLPQLTVPAGHRTVTDPAEPATCVKEGKTEGSHCDACNEVFVAQKIIPVTLHNVNSKNVCRTCNEDVSTQGLEFAENTDGNYKLTGLGAASDASAVYIPAEYNGKPVTAIGKEAIKLAKNLTAVFVPDSVTALGAMAFYSCFKLAHISLPDTLETLVSPGEPICNCPEVEYNVYDNARYLGNSENPYVLLDKLVKSGAIYSLDVPEGVKVINYDICYLGDTHYLTNLISLSLPESLVSIMDGAFWDCGKLAEVRFGSNLKYIGGTAFYSCRCITSLEIPDNVEYIGKNAFSGCKIETLSVPFIGESRDSSVNSHIGYVFGGPSYSAQKDYSPKYIRTLKVTDATAIGANALYGLNALETLILCDTVTEIGASAFTLCTKLTVYYTGTAEQWSGVSGNGGIAADRILFYSESMPADNIQSYWRYVDALPVKWGTT